VRPVVVLGSAAALVGGITAVLAPFIAPGVLRSFGVPFNPTEALKLQTMLRHLPPLVPTQRLRRPVLDLGSGDGRVVVAAAKQGYEAVGYEFNPWLVLYSRFAALSGGVTPLLQRLRGLRESTTLAHKLGGGGGGGGGGAGAGCARFVCGNMWKAPISDASCVVIYGVEELMPRFANKLEEQLQPQLQQRRRTTIDSSQLSVAPEAGVLSQDREVVVMSNTFPLPGARWEQRLRVCEEGVYVYVYSCAPWAHASASSQSDDGSTRATST
jgi:hypothetical protein